jgi:hypothetical protein
VTATQLILVTEICGEIIQLKLTAASIEQDQKAQQEQIRILLVFISEVK